MKRLRLFVPAFFLLAHLGLGLSIITDYGMAWDEPFERLHALVSARYLIEKFGGDGSALTDYRLVDYYDHFHGVFYTLSAYGLEQLLGETDYRPIYILRHHWTFLLFWLGTVAFYRLALRRLGDWRWALLAWAFLLLSPRIFGDSFYNPKDIPMLALYVTATLTLVQFLEKRSPGMAALHALACAAAISMRIVGVFLPVLTIGLVLVDLLNDRLNRRLVRQYILALGIYLPLLVGLTIAFWPYLWDQPFHRLGQAFAHMSKFYWPSKVLLRGNLIFATELPWYYAPYWMFITTPLWYTFLFVAGLVLFVRRVTDRLYQHGKLYTGSADRIDLVLLALFFGPLLSVIVFHSVIYDGWRHLYFIYPAFILFAVGALQQWWRRLAGSPDRITARCGRRALLAATIISAALTVHFMIRYHPHQNVYFNPLTLNDKLGQLDLDYWGLSYKQGFEALAELDPRDAIRVAVQNDPGKFNYDFLPPHLRKRFQLVEKPEEAEYYLSVFRLWEDGLQAVRDRTFPYDGEEVYAIYAEESKILGIYRIMR